MGLTMGAMAVPIPPDKLETWKAWTKELSGPRKADFDASNARHQITSHLAWLQANPDGSHLAIAVHQGPGADSYMMSMMQSDDPFDQWFMSTVADVHGMDPTAPPPPSPEQYI